MAGCAPGATPTSACALKCNIDAENYGFDVSCETGSTTNEMNNSTSLKYDSSGQVSEAIVSVDQKQTYSSSGNTYHIVGTITAHPIAGYADYDISATGGLFGDTPQVCKSADSSSGDNSSFEQEILGTWEGAGSTTGWKFLSGGEFELLDKGVVVNHGTYRFLDNERLQVDMPGLDQPLAGSFSISGDTLTFLGQTLTRVNNP